MKLLVAKQWRKNGGKNAAIMNEHTDFVGHSFTGDHLMKTFGNWKATTKSKFALEKPGSNLSGLPQRDELPKWEQIIINISTAAHEESFKNTRKAFKEARKNSNRLSAGISILRSPA